MNKWNKNRRQSFRRTLPKGFKLDSLYYELRELASYKSSLEDKMRELLANAKIYPYSYEAEMYEVERMIDFCEKRMKDTAKQMLSFNVYHPGLEMATRILYFEKKTVYAPATSPKSQEART